jgi:hypothetical protein
MSDSFAIFGVKLPSSDSASAPRSVETLVIINNYELRMDKVYSPQPEDKYLFVDILSISSV